MEKSCETGKYRDRITDSAVTRGASARLIACAHTMMRKSADSNIVHVTIPAK
jgi:hypothetical protein